MSVETPVLIAGSVVLVGLIAYITMAFTRQLRLRRHLKRLRTMPLDSIRYQ